jgi:hypothetical protein
LGCKLNCGGVFLLNLVQNHVWFGCSCYGGVQAALASLLLAIFCTPTNAKALKRYIQTTISHNINSHALIFQSTIDVDLLDRVNHVSYSCILSTNSALPYDVTCLEQLTCNCFATLCIGQGTSLKALPGFDGPAKGDSPRLGSRIQEEPKSCSLPYGKKKQTFQIWRTLQKWKICCFGIFHCCMRNLTKVEDLLLFWDLPLLWGLSNFEKFFVI